jgi:hypothetical protein
VYGKEIEIQNSEDNNKIFLGGKDTTVYVMHQFHKGNVNALDDGRLAQSKQSAIRGIKRKN